MVSVYQTASTYIIRSKQIRDTVDHDPDQLIDMRVADWVSFDVANSHNEPMTYALVGSGAGSAGLTVLGSGGTVGANTIECITVDFAKFQCSYLGIRASYATAPTSGQLTIVGTKRERIQPGTGPGAQVSPGGSFRGGELMAWDR